MDGWVVFHLSFSSSSFFSFFSFSFLAASLFRVS